MITADSVRYDAVVSSDTDTPHLDRLREQGINFQSATAPGPKTPESIPAIWTGEHPTRVSDSDSADDYSGWQSYWQARIKRHVEVHDTLPEQFQRAGYDTGAVSKNTWTSRPFGFDKGFSEFYDILSDQWIENFDVDRRLQHIPYAKDLYRLLFRKKSVSPWKSYYDNVLSIIDNLSEPYFFWVFLMDTHFPYLPPREYRSLSTWKMYKSIYKFKQSNWGKEGIEDSTLENLQRLYYDTIEYVDAFVGKLLDDLYAPTIIFFSDHGEAFGEHGYYYHSHHLYPENIHVPFLIGNVNHSITIEKPISLQRLNEVCETICDPSLDLRDELSSLAGEAISRSEEGNSLAIWTSDGQTEIDQTDGAAERLEHPMIAYRSLTHKKETELIRSAVEAEF